MFLCFCFFSHAQERTLRFMIDGGTDINKFATFDWSGRVGVGMEYDRRYFVGFTTGVTKFQEHPHMYIPVAAKLMATFPTESNVVPIIQLEPGYGFYNEQVKVDNKDYTMGGGFYLYAGVGAGLARESNTYFITAGFGNFAFSGIPYQFIHHRITVRVGIVF